MSVTVAEILKLPVLQDAVVAAGQRRLDNRVRWVHVSEQLDIARFLKGGELLLTTGMGLSVPPDRQVEFIRALAERRVAAVAIALVPWLRQVPAAVVSAAEEAGLPLLAFTRAVPFVQITEEVHTLIVNRHYAQIREAEAVVRQLNAAALQNQSVTAILRILYQVLRNPVACVSYGGSLDHPGESGAAAGVAGFAGARGDGGLGDHDGDGDGTADGTAGDEGELRSYYPPGDWGRELIRQVARSHLRPGGGAAPGGRAQDAATTAAAGATAGAAGELEPAPPPPVSVPLRLGRRTVDVWLQPIVISGEHWGCLAVAQANRRLDEVERLVVDRAAVTLAYEIVRRRSLREQRRGTLAQLADSILTGDVADEQLVHRRARALGHTLEDRWLAAATVQVPAGMSRSGLEGRISVAGRRLGVGGHLATWRAGHLRLLVYGPDEASLRAQMGALARELESGSGGPRILCGFGRPVRGLRHVPRSLQQAEFTLALRQRDPTGTVGPLFESTGTYRLLVAGVDREELRRFVAEEIGPLLQMQDPDAGVLLRTLRVLLDSNLAMAGAARLLGVCRQTIYQRRERIEQLLDCRLDDAERRLALGLALRALDSEFITAPRARA